MLPCYLTLHSAKIFIRRVNCRTLLKGEVKMLWRNKKNLSILLATSLFITTLFFTGTVNAETYVDLPPGEVNMVVQHTFNTGPSYFNTTLSNVPAGYDVVNGSYIGWCGDFDHTIQSNHVYNVTLYSSYDTTMPSYLWNDEWDKINYILNHHHDANWKQIQYAMWYILGFGDKGLNSEGWDIVNDTTANGEGFTPNGGEKIAVIADAGRTVQHTFFELTVPSTPGVNILKQVWDKNTGTWKKNTTTTLGSNLVFKVKVTNTGNVPLTNVSVVDDLPWFLTYNYDANNNPVVEQDHHVEWFFDTINVGEIKTMVFTAKTVEVGDGYNIVQVDTEQKVSDCDNAYVEVPCVTEAWVDDSWTFQGDVDIYDPNLMWGYNAFNKIQDAVNVLCECGVVHVLKGIYKEQIIINKNATLLAQPGTKIVAPDTMNSYTIQGSNYIWYPLVFAYGGTMTNNHVTGNDTISVIVDGFEIDGADGKNNTVGILYHNVKPWCTPNIISNNTIENLDKAIAITGCSEDVTIIHNWLLENSVAILVSSAMECEPTDVKAHYNYIYTFCSMDTGLLNQVNDTVNATFNWWGEDSGPSSQINECNHDVFTGRAADGCGEMVIGKAHFDPWVGVEASILVSTTTAEVDEVIHFDASDSFAYLFDGSPNNISYTWNLGNGEY
ncbi:MAG TPA: DUF11 domain-containing protein, partial [Thermoplasmatales archaeon]|nr:DUF11 domain-containing protein [Thermoplasmatales archaeon]